jgi:hypothetical protein
MVIDENFSYFLAGFFEGEGSLKLVINKIRGGFFSVAIRLFMKQSDRSVLEYLQKGLEFGKIYINSGESDRIKGKNAEDSWGLWISKFPNVKKIVKLLDGKLVSKQRTLDLIKEAISVMDSKRTSGRWYYTPEEIIRIAEIRDEIHRTSLKSKHQKTYRNVDWFKERIQSAPRGAIGS